MAVRGRAPEAAAGAFGGVGAPVWRGLARLRCWVVRWCVAVRVASNARCCARWGSGGVASRGPACGCSMRRGQVTEGAGAGWGGGRASARQARRLLWCHVAAHGAGLRGVPRSRLISFARHGNAAERGEPFHSSGI